jgi:hypothetical protein
MVDFLEQRLDNLAATLDFVFICDSVLHRNYYATQLLRLGEQFKSEVSSQLWVVQQVEFHVVTHFWDLAYVESPVLLIIIVCNLLPTLKAQQVVLTFACVCDLVHSMLNTDTRRPALLLFVNL